jgi:hypothetical protein
MQKLFRFGEIILITTGILFPNSALMKDLKEYGIII